MDKDARIHHLHYADSALPAIAEFIITRADALPDLSDTLILVRDIDIAPTLRHALLSSASERGCQALLGTQIVQLQSWLQHYYPVNQPVCSEQTRLLLLVDALEQAPNLLGQANPWSLAESLLRLFDELTLNRIRISPHLDEFASQLAALYRISGTSPSGLQQEAQLIHQLWHAWHTQLEAQSLIDPIAAQIIAMQRSLDDLNQYRHVHLVGIEPVYLAQQDWLNHCLASDHVHLWWQGTDSGAAHPAGEHLRQLTRMLEVPLQQHQPRSDYQQTLDNMFDQSRPWRERIQESRTKNPTSAIQDRLSIFSARSAEQEAHAIEFQIRQWLVEGKQSIGVVTENRLQARRLRALLERANITLQDTTGWALSTTRAAATLESLLLCLEEDFHKDALLDLLKSPLLFPDDDPEQRKNLVYRMEHDIIRNEQITSNLTRYQSAIRKRYQRLEEVWSLSPRGLLDLLERLERATGDLKACCSARPQPLMTYLLALQGSIDQLGLDKSLSVDAAGAQILELLAEMKLAAAGQTMTTSWSGFRNWLGRNLEEHYFTPLQTASPVQLLNLSQSGFRRFDAVVIANMEQDIYPGSLPVMPFFNASVRHQLALPDNAVFQASRQRHFYRLLFSADVILLSHRREQDGDIMIPSPWLASIRHFHQLVYQHDLEAATLAQAIQQPESVFTRCDSDVLPARQTQPRPQIGPDRCTTTFSASSYQQLMDCPYQFYAARILKLSAPEEIKQLLSKREYGERIHQCLQAFHTDVSQLPGPFDKPLSAENRAAAIGLLSQIAEQVFMDDIQDNYLHRGWFHQWSAVIPEYIEWQIEQAQTHRVADTEVEYQQTLANDITLKGRLDRVDRHKHNPSQLAVLDYKTGALPKRKEIDVGEKIQLPFYALLAETTDKPVTQVAYLPVGRPGEVKTTFKLEGPGLHDLRNDIGERLVKLARQIQTGHSMPAWEDDDVCRYCDMIGLCRCGTWQ